MSVDLEAQVPSSTATDGVEDVYLIGVQSCPQARPSLHILRSEKHIDMLPDLALLI